MKMRYVFGIFVLLCLCIPSRAEQAILISDAWVSEAPPGVKINAGYFSIENKTTQTISLLRVSSKDYARIEMHKNVVLGDMVKMEAQASVSIATQEKLQFRPGGYHLMLFQPVKYFQQGEFVTLQFEFSDGTVIPVRAEVRKLHARHHHAHH